VALNIGRIGGGTDAHEVAAVAGADIGVTFADAQAEQGAMSAFAALRAFRPGAVVTAEALAAVPAWPAESGQRLLAWAGTVGERHGLPVTGSASGWSGDVNHAGAQGVPSLDGFGAVGERIRTAAVTDERVRVDSLVPRAVLLAALLARQLPLGELR
jgi:glutamate carboxypeptidase